MNTRTNTTSRYPVIVLAGRRENSNDPLATAAGLSHKCLIPVAGNLLITHVLNAIAASEYISRIIISTDDPSVIDMIPATSRLREEGRLTIAAAQKNLVDSVDAALRESGYPVILTTADNAMLTHYDINAFVDAARSNNAAVAIAFARRDDVFSAHPQGQIRFYEFSDDAYSNCNLFWLSDKHALTAVESFREGGQFVKYPRRILRAFGVLNMFAFLFRWRSLSETMQALSRRFRVKIISVIVNDGALAIDVDNERTRNIAEELLTIRAKKHRA